jgi:cytoskeletal protein RodZ
MRSTIVSLATRRLRSLLIALAVLALSATVALAGRTATTPQHQVANQPQGGDQQAQESESPDASEAPDASDAPESPDPSQADSTDSTSGSTGVHPDNHGKLVSEAAQATTPAGFDSHGAYVKTIAQNNAGHAGAAAKHSGKTH